MIKVVAIIPARSGSKGVPDKNIKLLAGKPLLAYSIAVAKKAKNIDRVIVSTDSKNYASIAKEYGAEVPFLRPTEISSDTSTDLEFFQHALHWFREHENYCPQYVLNLRPTTPLRKVAIVEQAIKLLTSSPNTTALQSVQEMPETAYKSFEIEDGYLKQICTGSFNIDASHFSRRSYQATYTANGYVDILRSEMILEQNRLYGDKVIAYKTVPVTEIDTIEQFNYLEYQLQANMEIMEALFE